MTCEQELRPIIRVSTLELFFDLVFVFTITQFTNVLVHHLDGTGLVRVLLMLFIIWWMYGAYAWLTNAVAPNSTLRRTLLLTGMAGFLIVALAIPAAFDSSGWAFGAAYLVVNLVHLTLFLKTDNRASVRALYQLAPLNLGSALLVFLGGLLPLPYRYWIWAAAVVLQIATPYLHQMAGYTVVASHFVERHGLVIIIAIGESIVAIGLGFAGMRIDFGVIVVAVLGLSVAYYLWWVYFAKDDARSEHVLDSVTDPLRKARLALRGWGYAHYPMLLGIVALSAGVKETVGHAFDPLGWATAAALSGGVAIFLLGHAWFIGILGIAGVIHRVGAAAGVLAVIPLGTVVAVAQLVAVPVVMATAMIIEDIPELRRTHSTR